MNKGVADISSWGGGGKGKIMSDPRFYDQGAGDHLRGKGNGGAGIVNGGGR